MKKDAYKYSWNTWITSLLFSPVLFMILNHAEIADFPRRTVAGFFLFWILAIAISYVPSLISFFIFRFLVVKIVNTKWTITKRKNILAISGLTLTLIPLAIFIGLNDEWMDIVNLKLTIAYSATILFSIYYYELPTKQDDGNDATSTLVPG